MQSTKVTANITLAELDEFPNQETMIWLEAGSKFNGIIFSPIISGMDEDAETGEKKITFTIDVLDYPADLKKLEVVSWQNKPELAEQVGEVLQQSLNVFREVESMLHNNPESKPQTFAETLTQPTLSEIQKLKQFKL